MADTEKTAAPEITENPGIEAQGETPTPPSPPDIGGEGMAGTPGEVIVPSNVIDGLFEEKRAAAREAEKKAAEQDAAAKEAPGAEAQPKKGRGRPPKEDKAGKEPAPNQSSKQKQADAIGGAVTPQKTRARAASLWQTEKRSWNRSCGKSTAFQNRIKPLSRGLLPKKKRLSEYRMKNCTLSKTIPLTWRKTRNIWPLLPVSGRMA